MILCLVTDRRRLGAAMGARPDDWLDLLREQVAAAASAGVDLVQVREPDLEAAQLADLVRDLMKRVEGTATRLLVNDQVSEFAQLHPDVQQTEARNRAARVVAGRHGANGHRGLDEIVAIPEGRPRDQHEQQP